MSWVDTAIGGGVGFLVGGPAGAAVGAGIGSGMDINRATQDIASANNAWSAQQYATRYQTTVKDLEAAGLNPMLAYSQGAGSPPTAQQVQLQNPFSSGMQAYGTYAGAQQAFSSASQADAMVKQVDATTNKIIAETKNVSDQGLVLRMTAQELTARATLMAQQGATQQQMQVFYKQTVENLKKDGTLKQLDIDAAQTLSNLGRTSKELAPAVSVLLKLLSK